MNIRDDQILRSRLRAALDVDARIDAFELDVDVEGRTVRLHGVVGSYAEKLEAVSLAGGMDGVKNVVNDLTVRPYGERWRITDQQIKDDVRARIGQLHDALRGVQAQLEDKNRYRSDHGDYGRRDWHDDRYR